MTFRNLKLPFIAHHLDFKEIGLPELSKNCPFVFSS